MEAQALAVLVVTLIAYFFPAVIAKSRKHRNRGAITALNLLLGWTGLGWIAALIWSLTANTEDTK